jgi:hypothetical protein
MLASLACTVAQTTMRPITALLFFLTLFAVAKAALPDSSDFTRLRMEYADSADALFSWSLDEERVAALDAFKHDKSQFVSLALGWLKRCPIDARVRIMLASALSELGRTGETISHRYVYYGLLNSIAGKADGSSKENAFQVVSVDEEYDMCSYLGARVLGQRIEGHCDVLAIMLNEQKKELYFDASIVFRNQRRSLQKKE